MTSRVSPSKCSQSSLATAQQATTSIREFRLSKVTCKSGATLLSGKAKRLSRFPFIYLQITDLALEWVQLPLLERHPFGSKLMKRT